jgi:hypothetical protein
VHRQYIFFIHLFTNVHLGYFHILATVNMLQWVWECSYPLCYIHFSFVGFRHRGWVMDHTEVPFSVFEEPPTCNLEWLYCFLFHQ